MIKKSNKEITWWLIICWREVISATYWKNLKNPCLNSIHTPLIELICFKKMGSGTFHLYCEAIRANCETQWQTHLFWALLILHSCQTCSTSWLANRRGIFPPWWLVLSTLNTSDDAGILTHFWAEWESTGEMRGKVNRPFDTHQKQTNSPDCVQRKPQLDTSLKSSSCTCVRLLRWVGKDR